MTLAGASMLMRWERCSHPTRSPACCTGQVALDYNAGYQGALAGLLALQVPAS